MDQARARALLDGEPIPDERLADEAVDDEPEPDRSQGIHVERDDRPR